MAFNPDWISSPGDTIRDILMERELSADQLAGDIDVPLTTLEKILDGKKLITPDIATGLSSTLGATKEFWLNREDDYRITLSSRQIKDEDTRDWVKRMPVGVNRHPKLTHLCI